MEIELIGPIDYNKVKEILNRNIKEFVVDNIDNSDKVNQILNNINDKKKLDKILSEIQEVVRARRCEVVSTAGRLSRAPGDVLEVLKKSEGMSIDKNSSFINRVISMGHSSITDHDYFVFAIKNVSAIVEQTIIQERYSSFTIKSRREVDFSKAGYYVPEFHDKNGKSYNDVYLKKMYTQHMDKLFNNYSKFVDAGISKEDARFCLPYCFYSNIMMGVDAHVLFDMIIKFTKTKYSKVGELREFGNKLYNIAKENAPYLIPYIDSIPQNYTDSVDEYLSSKIDREPYKIIDKVSLLNNPADVDDQILIASIMRRYQYSYDKAKNVYYKLCNEDTNFKLDLMKKIAFTGDKLELSQVNFDFQIPVSYAILTHLTRHRTHKIIVPDFFPNIDLTQYKIPPKIKGEMLDFYKSIFDDNKSKYDEFKNIGNLGIRDEDLIYFTLSGNMTNVITNMDGWTLRHILELRECNKAQWETRLIAYGMHREVEKLKGAESFSKVLGSTCVTKGICNEGKECCGKIYALKKDN